MTHATTFPLTIGTLAERTGASPETIRYYERQGLLARPARSEGGHRRYGATHLRDLTFILRARRLGFGQDEVRELLSLGLGDGPDCHKVRHVAEHHLRGVQAKLEDLRRLEASLVQLVDECQRNAAEDRCPVVDALLQPLTQPDSQRNRGHD